MTRFTVIEIFSVPARQLEELRKDSARGSRVGSRHAETVFIARDLIFGDAPRKVRDREDAFAQHARRVRYPSGASSGAATKRVGTSRSALRCFLGCGRAVRGIQRRWFTCHRS